MLFTSVDADRLAADLEQIEGIESVGLWDHPYQVIAEQLDLSRSLRTRAAIEFEPFVHKPQLWKARLQHFRGAAGRAVDKNRGNLEFSINDHREAGRLYTDENVRPTDRVIERLEADDVRRAWNATKQNATYWQGLLSYDRGDYQVSHNWLEKAAQFEPWQTGALYNRARAREALGRDEEAIELLESSDGPDSRGNRIRAARLKQQTIAQESQ